MESKYPAGVYEEYLSLMRQAEKDPAVLDMFIDNFTATVCRDTPKLAAHRWRVTYERRIEQVRAMYEKHKDAPDGRWWPEIVAGCLLLDAAWEGRLPRPKNFEAIVAHYLGVSEETADQLVSFSGCHDGGSYFHTLWLEIASDGPGLKDALAEAGLL